MAQLEVSLLVGKESKQWLADVTALVDRLEKAAKKLGASGDINEDTEAEEDADETSDDDDDDFAVSTKKKAVQKASSFDDEDETEEADEDEADEAPIKKKAKKLTVDDVNDACKKRAQATGGKEGRQEVLNILKKKFKTTSVSELKPEQYASVIAAMKA